MYCHSNREPVMDDIIFIYGDFDKSKFRNNESYQNHMEGFENEKMNQLNEANRYFKLALQMDQNNSIILNSLAINESRLANYDIAIELLKRVIIMDSLYFESYVNLAQVYTMNGEYEKSIEYANKVIARNPAKREVMGAWYNKSFAEYELKQYDSALNSVDRAIKLCDNTDYLEKFDNNRSTIVDRMSQELGLKNLLEKE